MEPQRTKRKLIEPDFLLVAYASGYFPMAESADGEINWYSPDPRAVIDLKAFHIPRSLQLTLRKELFRMEVDRDFESVIRECARREETWISEEIVQAYMELHKLGYAHSVECWQKDELVGGLYGVALGAAFFGESMFSRKRDASKVALVHLVRRLNDRGYLLLDTQFNTPHLQRFGALEISRDEYLKQLKTALRKYCQFV
jgi:leucyl/phenylalanyl-tRNA--protein transferase